MARCLADHVDVRFGAPMGRPPYTKNPETGEWFGWRMEEDPAYAALCKQPRRFYLQKARLDSGGYDQGGAYWGLGEPVYIAQDEDDTIQRTYRATSRAHAKQQLRAEFPHARFFN